MLSEVEKIVFKIELFNWNCVMVNELISPKEQFRCHLSSSFPIQNSVYNTSEIICSSSVTEISGIHNNHATGGTHSVSMQKNIKNFCS